MQIIMLSGKMGSGKTTLQKLLVEKLSDAVALNFADVIYEIHNFALDTLADYGLERDIKKDGTLLQLLGTEWGRNSIHENIWCKMLRNRCEMVGAETIVIGDCRFPNEFYFFPEALRVRLQASKDIRKKRCEAWRANEYHPSEVALDKVAVEGRFDLTLSTEVLSAEDCVQKITKILSTDWPSKRTMFK